MIGRVLHSPLVTGDNAGRTPYSRPKGALQFATQWRRFQPGSARTKSSRVSEPVGWAESIGRPTCVWAEPLRSKCSRLMLLATPAFRARFEREAKAISSLNHPHICTLHDIGHQEGTDFLVMEYLEGETLSNRLARGPLPLAQALQTGIEIADALDKAHRRDTIRAGRLKTWRETVAPS